jgi:hypothetical protein
VPFLETLSKRAALASIVAVIALLLGTHVDLTLTLKALVLAALAIGWITTRRDGSIHPAWLLIAPLAPAILRIVTDREGPVLDMVWMAGLSGALFRSVSASNWALPATWRVFAGGWALTLSLAWPVFVLREAGFDPDILFDRGAINSSGLLSAPQTVGWILYVTWLHLLGLLWLDWATARFTTDRERVPAVAYGLCLGVTLSSVVALYQGIVDLRFLSTEFWFSEARATGTMLDANAYGMCAAVAGPIAFTLLHARGATAAGAAVLLLNLAGVWMSGSRVPFFGAGIGVAALVLGLWTTLTTAGRQRLAVSAAAGVAALTIVLLAGGTIGPLRRLAELPRSPTEALDAAVNRPPYGETAMRMLRDYPVTGVGIGSYQIFASDYYRQQADDALPFDSAQNWWRHEGAELGVLGGITLFIWSAAIAWTVLTIRTSRKQRLTAIVVRGLLIAAGICSVIQMPTHSPIVLLWFLFLLAWLVGGLRDGTGEPAPAFPSETARTAAWVVVTVLAVAYAGTHVALATGALDVAERARRLQRPYMVGTYPVERLEDGTPFRWTGKEARLQLPARTAWVVFRIWAHHPDIEERPVEVELAAPCGVVFTTTLTSTKPLPVGIELPPGLTTFDARVRVSRTWSPSELGTDDKRQLGAGIIAEFVDDRQLVFSQNQALEWPECP